MEHTTEEYIALIRATSSLEIKNYAIHQAMREGMDAFDVAKLVKIAFPWEEA